LGVVPLLEVECGLFEDVDRPNIVVFECVSEKDDVVWGDLVIVLVVLVGLAGRRARRGTSSVGPVARRFSAIPMMLPDLSRPHAAFGWRIHCGVEVTEWSTNKQHTLSGELMQFECW